MNIIVYGNDDDTSFDGVLIKALAKYGIVHFFSKSKLICTSHEKNSNKRKQFFVYEVESLPKLIKADGIFLFKKTFKNLDKNKFPTKFLPIVDEQNLNAIKFLQKTGQIVITCGASTKNTLSFSSITHKKAIVALQRYLNFDNIVIEPHEFTVKLSLECAPNVLLAICTVLLLSGISSINGYEI